MECSAYTGRGGTKLVDVSGKWMIPGLIDVHVHLTSPCCTLTDAPDQRLLTLLRAGITTVRDVGAWADSNWQATQYRVGYGQVERMAGLVEQAARASPPGPRILYCGPGLYSSDSDRFPADPSFRPNSIRLRSSTNVDEVVTYLVDRGASCIKLYSGVSPRHMREVLEAAATHGVPGIGHSADAVRLETQLEWPWREIHHLYIPVEDLLPPERRRRLPVSSWARMWVSIARFDPASEEAAALAAKVAQRGVAWVPTLTVTRGGCRALCWEVMRITAAPGDSMLVREALFDPANPPRSAADSVDATRPANLRFVNGWIALLHRAGVPILAGSDSPQEGVPLGTALHSELGYLVAAGLSPAEALAAATRNAAIALGLIHRIGTLRAGKVADFVVLDADPLADIRNVGAIRHVVFGGALLDLGAHPRRQ